MKKRVSLLCMLLVFSMLLTPLCAAADNYDTIADWDIRIAVPEGATAVLKGNEYYLYAQKVGSIPYVLLKTYKVDSELRFLAEFIDALKAERSDLEVMEEPVRVAVGDKVCYETMYSYSVSGNKIVVRLLAITVGERTYAFLSKEVPARRMTVGSMLEEVVTNCEFLGAPKEDTSGLDELEDEIDLSPGYLYTLKDGMPKYWLDFTGAMADDPVLHCFFRSGEPTFYERCFILDLDSADFKTGRIDFRTGTDENGFDVSNWFTRLTLRFGSGGDVSLNVRRDKSTLAGGAEDNLLDGVYTMKPVKVGGVYACFRDDGKPKYWLDLGGGQPELHAMFRSDSPSFYETVFYLDMKTAEEDGYSVRIRKVTDRDGRDVSNWFKSFTLTQVQGAILMNVVRDERTLAGGAEDNILTDVYLLEPRTYVLPAEDGPYTPAELGRWAQIYYFRSTGFYPPEVDVTKNRNGSYTIQLFETVDSGGTTHTATSAWYTVNRRGEGTDGITGLPVRLFG